MLPGPFDYVRPGSLDEAIAILGDREGAVALAGGQSLLTDMKAGRSTPAILVDLRGIKDLVGIRRDREGLHIGAMTTHARIGDDRTVREACPALTDAIERITDPQVRNRGTIGGSLSRNDPAADLPAVALALDAMIKIAGSTGPRTVAAGEFLAGPFKTLAKRGDVVAEVFFSGTAGAVVSAYEKFKNPATGLALCGIAALLRRSSNGAFEKCRVAATGVADCAVRLRGVEEALAGAVPTAETLAAAAERSAEGLCFVSDLFATGEYRKHLCAVLTKRALMRAFDRGGGR